jgi:hypothetical protein
MSDPEPTTWQTDINEAHRAIGRYFVAFSRLVAHMRGLMSQRLVIETGDKVELAELAFGAMAQQVADSFFAMCRYDGNLSEAEKGVCELLCRAVNDEIEWRNKFAHGVWWISARYGDPANPELIRTTPKKREGLPAELTHHPPKEMDERSDALWELVEHVVEFGALAFGLRVIKREGGSLRMAKRREYRVEDVFTFTPPRKSGKNPQRAKYQRNGPKAAEVVNPKAALD